MHFVVHTSVTSMTSNVSDQIEIAGLHLCSGSLWSNLWACNNSCRFTTIHRQMVSPSGCHAAICVNQLSSWLLVSFIGYPGNCLKFHCKNWHWFLSLFPELQQQPKTPGTLFDPKPIQSLPVPLCPSAALSLASLSTLRACPQLRYSSLLSWKKDYSEWVEWTACRVM